MNNRQSSTMDTIDRTSQLESKRGRSISESWEGIRPCQDNHLLLVADVPSHESLVDHVRHKTLRLLLAHFDTRYSQRQMESSDRYPGPFLRSHPSEHFEARQQTLSLGIDES